LIEAFSIAFEKTTEKVKRKAVVYKDAEGDIISVTNEDDFKVLLDYVQKNKDTLVKVRLIKRKMLGFGRKCHNKKKIEKNVHIRVKCDGCKKFPIIGNRFKCGKCKNFDYCDKCFAEKEKEHGHPFVKIETNDQKNVHHGVKCDGCEIAPILGIRYKCKECKKIDFCEKCFAEKEKEHGHEFFKIETNDQKNVHHFVACDGCGISPIVGIRYKCGICKNFDFCEKCEKEKGEEHGHCFIKIRQRNSFEEMKKKWIHRFMKFFRKTNPCNFKFGPPCHFQGFPGFNHHPWFPGRRFPKFDHFPRFWGKDCWNMKEEPKCEEGFKPPCKFPFDKCCKKKCRPCKEDKEIKDEKACEEQNEKICEKKCEKPCEKPCEKGMKTCKEKCDPFAKCWKKPCEKSGMCRPPFGMCRPPFGMCRPPFGMCRPPFGMCRPPSGMCRPPFGKCRPPFGMCRPPFGMCRPPFGKCRPPFGMNFHNSDIPQYNEDNEIKNEENYDEFEYQENPEEWYENEYEVPYDQYDYEANEWDTYDPYLDEEEQEEYEIDTHQKGEEK
jgi:hypothetical protein